MVAGPLLAEHDDRVADLDLGVHDGFPIRAGHAHDLLGPERLFVKIVRQEAL